jgi:TonB family protein
MADHKDDIEKYLKGELSPSEMHALENKALYDPFLADALEGASTIQTEDFSSDLSFLRSKLSSKEAKTIPLWLWASRIAAGIVLVGLVVWLFLNNQQPASEKIALNEQKANPGRSSDKAVKEDSIAITPSETPAPETAQTQQVAPMKQRSGIQKTPALPKTNQVETFPLEDSEGSIAAIDSQASTNLPPVREMAEAQVEEEKIQNNQEIVGPTISSHGNDDSAYAYTKVPSRAEGKSKEVLRRVITGTVLDAEDGKGLPGVNVTVKGTNIGTITDEEGRYKISADSLAAGLLFTFIGYENKEVTPGADPALDVALSPDIAQLSEIVVVGYGGTKREDPEFDPIIELASPAGGRKAYKQYLESNLRYPQQALNNKVEGKVTVQFTVESSGKTTDFKILKGIGFGCDEEVVRLIQEGPKWRPTRRNTEPVNDKIKVRMRFSIPKK